MPVEQQMEIGSTVEAPIDSSVVTEPQHAAADVSVAPEVNSRLTIRGPGLTFERSVPDAVVLQIIRLVLTGTAGDNGSSASTPFVGDTTAPTDPARRESLAEYYRRANPTKNPEKLVTIGAYLLRVLDRTSFTSDDLKAQFRSVNEAAPANMPRDFRLAIGAGWIAEEHGQPGQFFVTRTGFDAVEASFATAARPVSRVRRRRRTRTDGTVGATDAGE